MWRRLTAVALAVLATSGGARADTYFSDLTLAAIRGQAERVSAILLWGGNPNWEGWLGLTPLSAAVRSCRSTPAVVEALIDAGADIESRSGVGATPLMIAWQNGREDLAEVLLRAGADPSARNLYGDSADEYRRYFAGDLPEEEFATLRYTALGFRQRGETGRAGDCDPFPSAQAADR